MQKEKISEFFQESISVISDSQKLESKIYDAIGIIITCFENGNKVVTFGNGGSAADAQHLAAEFVGRYKTDRKSLPAIAFTTDTSIITSIGNDYSFDDIFARQCDSLVNENDVVIAISTSGKSQNVINGVITSKKKGALIIALTGGSGGELQNLSDIVLSAPSDSTPRIQEVHRIIMHIFCEFVDEQFKNS